MIDRIDIKNEYLSIKNHLDCFWDTINKRTNKGYTPYNLRSCAYMDDFNKQKIVYSETNNQKNTKIALDSNSYCTDKTCFILVANNYNIDIEYIYKVLSSSVFSFYMNLISPLLGDSGISLTKESVIKFPLAKQGLKNFNNVFELYSLNDKEKEFIVKYFE